MREILPKGVIERIQTCRTLPTMPAVAVAITRLCNSEDVAIIDIADVVQQDPALSARILRYANGTPFGARGSVTTVRRAAVLLGSKLLQSLALSLSMTASLQGSRVAGFDHQRYWKRSLFCAAAAQAVATATGAGSAEELFVAALLQDIGMLALAHALGDEYTDLVGRSGRLHHELYAAERATLGFDHADVSAWLVKEWSLPPIFSTVAEESHRAVAVAAAANPHRVTISGPVLVSSHVADIFCADDVSLACQRAAAAAGRLLGMTIETLVTVLAQTRKHAAAGGALLHIDPGLPTRTALVVERANRALEALSFRPLRRPGADLSVRDPRTGLWNRVHIDRVIDGLLHKLGVAGGAVHLAFCDVDGLGEVNDSFGHAAGDEVLWTVGTRIAQAAGDGAVLGRYSGGRFLVVMPDSSREEALGACERVREAVCATPVAVDQEHEVPVTISVGVAGTDGGGTPRAPLIRAVEGALGAAKRAGKNRVCAAIQAVAAGHESGPGPGSSGPR